jgi:ribonuclease VapC
MIAVDTSALMAIILSEPQSTACKDALDNDGEIVISAATVAEAHVVAAVRRVSGQMARLLTGLELEVVPVSADTAERVGAHYRRWGRGLHGAGLNYGDCFAYDTAQTYGCPLLFIGNDFRKTDIPAVLTP